VTTVDPSTTPGSQAARWASVPNSAMASEPVASVSITGT